MFHGTEEWCKVWRKTDSWFQKWHEEFGEFSPNHSKVWKFYFDGLFLSKGYEVWAKKEYRGVIFHDAEVMQNLNKPWPCGFKNGIINWVNFHQSTQSLKNCTIVFIKSIYFFSYKISEELCVKRLKGDGKFKGKLTCGLKNDLGISLIFMRAVESLKICTLMGFFWPKNIKI